MHRQIGLWPLLILALCVPGGAVSAAGPARPDARTVLQDSPTAASSRGVLDATILVPLKLPQGAKPLEMVLIPAGTFIMGSSPKDAGSSLNEGPKRHVTITKPFYLGKYEVTQAQWKALIGKNPSEFKGNNRPVETIEWKLFIDKLNRRGKGIFRLPTEAEWEYACRAGTTTRYYWGDDLDNSQAGNHAWYDVNSAEQTHEVGLKLPNAWGLFDMCGNVYEWCSDRYGDYRPGPKTDPQGLSYGAFRVLRGGSWQEGVEQCRSAARSYDFLSMNDSIIGIRIALDAPPVDDFGVQSSEKPENESSMKKVAGGPTITVPLADLPAGAKPLEMVLIPAGTFRMGEPVNEEEWDCSASPPHEVTISRPFYMGKYEITQAQWQAVMGKESLQEIFEDYLSRTYGIGKNYPMYCLAWDQCLELIQALNQLGVGTFRLPTEAEWEYACRAGTTTRYYWGDSDAEEIVEMYCWHETIIDDADWTDPSPYLSGNQAVGQKLPNAFGLFDMSGNVWEWCQDWFGPYSSAPQTDPTGPATGEDRVFRGGSGTCKASECTSTNRRHWSVGMRYTDTGLRLVRDP